jgi:CRISPR-associated endonuclease Csy4
MKYYIEISLIQQKDLSCGVIWSKLYEKLHLMLVKLNAIENIVKIGFTFPEYRFDECRDIGMLGGKLRIFANTENELVQLNLKETLNSLNNYVHLTSIKNTPSYINSYIVFKRKQFKTSAENLARRNSRRSNIDYNLALNKYQNKVYSMSNLPFINFSSKTNNNKFKLFLIKQTFGTITDNKFIFNTYGLSFGNVISYLPDF